MDFYSLLPPVLALLIVLVTRSVYVALLSALFLSETLILQFNPLLGSVSTIDRMIGVFESTGNARILVFCVLIGILIVLMRQSGGVSAFAHGLIKSGMANTSKRAETAVAATGTLVFVETNVSLLSSGVLGRALYDAHKLTRQRLAFIIDSTSAPISVLMLMFNAWGAYALGLLGPFGYENPTGIVAATISYNFYAIIAVLMVYFTAFSGKVFGPLASQDSIKQEKASFEEVTHGKAIYMWLPLVIMVATSLLGMVISGNGNITKGDGSQSILIAIILAIIALISLLKLDRVFEWEDIEEHCKKGVVEMLPLVGVLLLAIAFGSSLKELGTGVYVASSLDGTFPAFLLPAILFCAAAITSFMTGTSWGTYGLLIPIAMPLAATMGIPPSLALAAVLGGGVMGDHCSPISDTTLIASVAAGTEHLAHVRTQLPYALFAGSVAILGYLIAGFIMAT